MKIKFCTIEHTNKVVWKYKQGQPNYLCDPDTEIDPTAYGCWVSAMQGENLPISFLRYGKKYKNNFWGKIYRLQDKIAGRTLFRNIKYLKKFNIILALAHRFNFQEIVDCLEEARKVNRKAFYIGVLGNCPGLIRQAILEKKNFQGFIKFLKAVDLFINNYQEAQKYFELLSQTIDSQNKLGEKKNSEKIVFLPQFYPFHFAKEFKKNYQEKEKIIHLAGPTDREDNLANQYVAVALQREFPEFLITIPNLDNLNIEPLKLARARYKVFPQMKWQDYLSELSRSFLVLNLDNIWTMGRVVADCAGVGTPCIGINATNQFKMFPSLRVEDMIGIQQAVILGKKLIEERKFYEHVVKYACEKVEEQNYKKRKRALIEILKRYKKG